MFTNPDLHYISSSSSCCSPTCSDAAPLAIIHRLSTAPVHLIRTQNSTNQPTNHYSLLHEMRILGSYGSNLQMFDSSLRICVVPFAAASIWVNVTSRGESVDYGKLEFKNLLGLKYMVCVSAVSAGYALLTALASCLRCITTKQWVFFVADQVFAYLVLTSTAAQIEFLYLAYHGNLSVAWGRACVTLGKMCIRMKLGLGLNVTVLWCFMVLSVISGYRLFRTFQPPAAPSSKEAHQEEGT